MGFGLIIQRHSHIPAGGWPECSGMGGRIGPESVAGLGRNTQRSRRREPWFYLRLGAGPA